MYASLGTGDARGVPPLESHFSLARWIAPR